MVKINFNIIKEIIFPDHYQYNSSEINNIKNLAKKLNAKIMTTEKDHVRISTLKTPNSIITCFKKRKRINKFDKNYYMKLIKYFIQFLIISIFFILFKVLGLRMASNFSKIIFSLLGPFFRSKKTINKNILKALPNLSNSEINKISRTMWGNYGRILV